MAKGSANRYEEFTSVGRRMNELLLGQDEPVSKKTMAVLVVHCFYSALPTVEAAAQLVGKDNLMLVLKGSSHNDDFERDLKADGYRVSDLRKKHFKKRPDKVVEQISRAMKEAKCDDVLVLDHGGYFAYQIQDLAAEIPFKGIVEYTINGVKKYDPVFGLNPNDVNYELGHSELPGFNPQMRYLTVAKSPLKQPPDFSCGRLIGELTQQIVQEYRGFGLHLRGISQVGVIGYGNLGSKVAEKLRDNGAHNIMVVDTNLTRMNQAFQDGYNITCSSVADLVGKCNVIIVGTDTAPIEAEMYGAMRGGTFIGTVTSADDSLGLDKLIEQGVLKRKNNGNNGRVTPYLTADGRTINLIQNGEAPNLMTGIGVDDTTIFQPNLEHMLLGKVLLQGEPLTKDRLRDIRTGIEAAHIQTIREFQATIEASLNGAGRG